jgi:hypothetical protein
MTASTLHHALNPFAFRLRFQHESTPEHCCPRTSAPAPLVLGATLNLSQAMFLELTYWELAARGTDESRAQTAAAQRRRWEEFRRTRSRSTKLLSVMNRL